MRERIRLAYQKWRFRKKYDLICENLDCASSCFSHGLSLLPDFVTRHVKGKLIIDAGAYVGDSALSFLPYNPQKILSFEPSSEIFQILEQNCYRIKDLQEKCEIFQLALGDKTDTLNFCNSSASGSHHEDKNSPFTVKQTTIDSFISGRDTPVGLIKADIEGMGLKMIQGAKQTILRDHPLLTIAVYHCPDEMFGIRETLKSWGLNYICRYEFLEPQTACEMTLIAYPAELDGLAN